MFRLLNGNSVWDTRFVGLVWVVFAGCSIDQLLDFDQSPSLQTWRPVESRVTGGDYPASAWVGENIDSLIEVRGPPAMVLEARPKWTEFKDGVPVLSYIYPASSTAGQSCIDTFVVVETTGLIVKYYCR